MSVLSTQLKTMRQVLGKWKSPAHFSASALPVAASGLPILNDAVSVGKERPAGGFLADTVLFNFVQLQREAGLGVDIPQGHELESRDFAPGGTGLGLGNPAAPGE